MKKIFIIDTSSMFFRAFYAVRPLTSTEGTPVNAVYGFVSMIMKLIKEKNPEYIVFCYDRKEPSFRKDLDENYKANRTVMPDDLQVQMPYIKQVAGLFGITDIEVPLYEADDLIGTIARLSEREGFESYIVSGDKDFCQVVSDKIFIYDTMKEVITTPELVREKYGVTTDQFIDYLAITGDTSDNIPGVKGIGPKGALALIEQFNTLENIYENIDDIKSLTIKEKLKSSKDNAFLSKKLVTIVTDVKIGMTLEDFKRKPVKEDELRSFFKLLNFKSFEKSFFADSALMGAAINSNQNDQSAQLDFVSGRDQVEDFADFGIEELLWNSKDVQNRMKSESFFCFLNQSNFCIGFKPASVEKKYQLFLAPVSEINFDLNGMTWSGFDIKSIWSQIGLPVSILDHTSVENDLMLGSYLLRSQDSSDFKKCFKALLKKEIDSEATPIKIFSLFIELQFLVNQKIAELNMTGVLQNCDLPMIKILYRMEKNGIKIDVPLLQKYSQELGLEIKDIENRIQELAGEKFNVASPKQLAVVLFEKMKIASSKKTKTGYSTDSDVLEKIEHPIGKELLNFRELSKLKSTYVDTLPELCDQTGRVHSTFLQAATATGRFSSVNPNLQNIPIRTERGKKIRLAFIAEEGKHLLSVDYSQIELRVLADIAGDPGLIDAFQNDLDIHAATAAEVFSVRLKEVTSEQRRIAKAVNFGIAYGQGAFGLAETLGVSRTESKEIITKYFIKFKGIKEYIDSTIELAHKNKYVETKFGRRRFIAELESSNMMLKKFGERAAINAPIQGTASDLVKMAMIDVEKLSSLKLLLQVHDELVFEGTQAEIEKNLPKIKFAMENVAKLKVPLKVNSASGMNWGEAH